MPDAVTTSAGTAGSTPRVGLRDAVSLGQLDPSSWWFATDQLGPSTRGGVYGVSALPAPALSLWYSSQWRRASSRSRRISFSSAVPSVPPR